MRDPGACGAREPRRVRPIADDEDDFGRVGRVGSGIDQRLQVRSAARNQNADLEPCHGAVPWRLRIDGRDPLPKRPLGPLSMASPRKLRYHRIDAVGEPRTYGIGAILQ